MAAMLAIAWSIAPAQERPTAGAATQPSADSRSSTDDPRAPDRARLERQFAESLTNVVFKGTWQMTGEEGLRGDAPLGPPREEQYTISKAEKLRGEHWLISARIQYADKDVTIPVPVRVVWAGDTPIITLDNLGLPGLGTYSARVMVYRGFYSGTWFGKNYGGILSGQILKRPNDEPLPTSGQSDEGEAPARKEEPRAGTPGVLQISVRPSAGPAPSPRGERDPAGPIAPAARSPR